MLWLDHGGNSHRRASYELAALLPGISIIGAKSARLAASRVHQATVLRTPAALSPTAVRVHAHGGFPGLARRSRPGDVPAGNDCVVARDLALVGRSLRRRNVGCCPGLALLLIGAIGLHAGAGQRRAQPISVPSRRAEERAICTEPMGPDYACQAVQLIDAGNSAA
jgi:hypothetical protein